MLARALYLYVSPTLRELQLAPTLPNTNPRGLARKIGPATASVPSALRQLTILYRECVISACELIEKKEKQTNKRAAAWSNTAPRTVYPVNQRMYNAAPAPIILVIIELIV